jgi:hypothetical protein
MIENKVGYPVEAGGAPGQPPAPGLCGMALVIRNQAAVIQSRLTRIADEL